MSEPKKPRGKGYVASEGRSWRDSDAYIESNWIRQAETGELAPMDRERQLFQELFSEVLHRGCDPAVEGPRIQRRPQPPFVAGVALCAPMLYL